MITDSEIGQLYIISRYCGDDEFEGAVMDALKMILEREWIPNCSMIAGILFDEWKEELSIKRIRKVLTNLLRRWYIGLE